MRGQTQTTNPLRVPRRPVIAMHNFDSNAASVEGSIYLAALTLARPALNVIYTWPLVRDFDSSAAGAAGHIYLAALTLARLALKVIYTWPFVCFNWGTSKNGNRWQ